MRDFFCDFFVAAWAASAAIPPPGGDVEISTSFRALFSSDLFSAACAAREPIPLTENFAVSFVSVRILGFLSLSCASLGLALETPRSLSSPHVLSTDWTKTLVDTPI